MVMTHSLKWIRLRNGVVVIVVTGSSVLRFN